MPQKAFNQLLFSLIFSFILILPVSANAQAMFFRSANVGDSAAIAVETAPVFQKPERHTLLTDTATLFRALEDVDSFMDSINPADYKQLMAAQPLPHYLFMPAVYTGFEYGDDYKPFDAELSGVESLRWAEEGEAMKRRIRELKRALFFGSPELVPYNINTLPEAPKHFNAVVDPTEHTIVIHETTGTRDIAPTLHASEVKKTHWLRTFNALLQFSQAYISPNWYQGGNNNLNMLANILYNVKLNPEFHPNLLFETTAQYKLGMNSAPDDSIHNYNISDDLFQVNSTFGVKAAKRWYYSLTAQFKTQLLNSFETNSHKLRSAFLSPGELTAGIGMTYNYANAKKTCTFDASIAPLSYSLKTCIDRDIDPALYDIEPGRIIKHSFGSSVELKLFWKICYNISFSSRLFAFTNYESAQADWENKLSFDINRFLSTQVYAHVRYDTNTPKCEDANWKKLQVKEILSIGFAYKFSSI